jgi:hypothetical protein
MTDVVKVTYGLDSSGVVKVKVVSSVAFGQARSNPVKNCELMFPGSDACPPFSLLETVTGG